jgi:uncharacterized membrane protein YfcA
LSIVLYREKFTSMTFQYWYLLPVSILVATTAMASGVGGATFFSPIFILALRLPPDIAIGTALITEVFGFASGVYAYGHKKLIDYRLGIMLLTATVPLALLGTWLSGRVPSDILKIILGMGLMAIAMNFLRTPDRKEIESLDRKIGDEHREAHAGTTLLTAQGEEIKYTVCNRIEGSILAGIGGLFVGLISTGLGEMNGYFLLQRCRVPSKVAVATSVFVVAITALSASGGHLVRFMSLGSDTLSTVLSIVIFTVPGVVIGAQLGSYVGERLPQRTMERTIGILFILVALATLGEAVF